MLRTTKEITFNLNDRGRVASGKDRSSVDTKAMIAKINSPEVQEHVQGGTLNGFYGHQIRQLYGMEPPESIPLENGEILMLEPASRTIFLHAKENGEVTHKQEFFNNPAGRKALTQYRAKVGGFSLAVNYFIDGMRLVPNILGGMDYVFAQNFLENRSIGLFDSANGNDSDEVKAIIEPMLKYEIISLYDSIYSEQQNLDYMNAMAERAKKAESDLNKLRAKNKRRIEAKKMQSVNEYDSALRGSMIDFNEQMQIANRFLTMEIAQEQKQETNKKQSEASAIGSALTNLVTGFR